MEVRGQHQALATLPLGKQPLLPTKWRAKWASESIWMQCMVLTAIHTYLGNQDF